MKHVKYSNIQEHFLNYENSLGLKYEAIYFLQTHNKKQMNHNN